MAAGLATKRSWKEAPSVVHTGPCLCLPRSSPHLPWDRHTDCVIRLSWQSGKCQTDTRLNYLPVPDKVALQMRVKTRRGRKNKGRRVAAATEHLASGRLPTVCIHPQSLWCQGRLKRNGGGGGGLWTNGIWCQNHCYWRNNLGPQMQERRTESISCKWPAAEMGMTSCLPLSFYSLRGMVLPPSR